MTSAPRIATAVALGYLLGRSRKMKLAIAVGGLLVGRRITTDPVELLRQANKALAASPELNRLLGEARSHLTDAAKAAVTAAAANKIDELGESLTERAGRIRSGRGGAGAVPEQRAQDQDQEQEQEQEQTEPSRSESTASSGGDCSGRNRRPARRSTSTGEPGRRSTRTRGSSDT
ncbi:hypothetical protein [Saccharopolyspora rosea]|uniref:DNA primase n=1 Tax=Saccharopolyspora rosea TaxID=524884 RepID=A0ABW3FWB9_9PSEU|nr:hypothetical protein [Saccharopolyspora rosea]